MDLKKASSLGRETKKVECYFLIAEAIVYNSNLSLEKLCKKFGVSRSGFYLWKNRSVNPRDEEALHLISTIFNEKKQRSGARTIKMILERKHKIVMNLKKISRIKNKYGLETIIRRRNKYRYVAKGGADHQFVPNLLRREFNPGQVDRVYSTDITYLNFGNGQRAYLSAVKDLGSKEIVHFKVAKNIQLELATDGLDIILKKLSPTKRQKLIIHSDQGTHYTTKGFRETLKRYRVTQSMSRRGNCIDNAPIESFFGHLKDEIDLKNCKRYDELISKVTNYIDYYNNDRPQWDLKRKTPAECRRLLT